MSRSAKWRSQTNFLGLLGRERNFIYYKQLCKGPSVVPGLLGGWRYSAHRGEALGGQALLGSCLVWWHPQCLTQSRHALWMGSSPDQEPRHAPGPSPWALK